MKSTFCLLQKDLFELRRDLDSPCNRTKETTKKVLGKWSAECEALRDNLKAAAAARSAEKEQSIEVSKQELADRKVKAAKKGGTIGKLQKMNDQLRSELDQLEH